MFHPSPHSSSNNSVSQSIHRSQATKKQPNVWSLTLWSTLCLFSVSSAGQCVKLGHSNDVSSSSRIRTLCHQRVKVIKQVKVAGIIWWTHTHWHLTCDIDNPCDLVLLIYKQKIYVDSYTLKATQPYEGDLPNVVTDKTKDPDITFDSFQSKDTATEFSWCNLTEPRLHQATTWDFQCERTSWLIVGWSACSIQKRKDTMTKNLIDHFAHLMLEITMKAKI